MLAGRSIARPDSGCPSRGRESARRLNAPAPDPLDCEPDDPDVTREEAPEEDPPEQALDPPRGAADPDRLLDADEEGVREPAGLWALGISTTRAGSGPLELEAPPEVPDEPAEPDEPDEPAGRGIA
jgi:hypothetical protein